MGRAPCCDKANVKKGPWSPEEDAKLKSYIEKNGTGGNWIALPQKIGLKRCGKSCRLRWLNYLRPNIKHGGFSEEEDNIICSLYVTIGSRWSIIAAQLPGRTDNDIKNYWNTRLKKKLLGKQRKEQQAQARRASNQKQQEIKTENENSFVGVINNNQPPYWPPQYSSVPIIPLPNSSSSPLNNNQTSLTSFLINHHQEPYTTLNACHHIDIVPSSSSQDNNHQVFQTNMMMMMNQAVTTSATCHPSNAIQGLDQNFPISDLSDLVSVNFEQIEGYYGNYGMDQSLEMSNNGSTSTESNSWGDQMSHHSLVFSEFQGCRQGIIPQDVAFQNSSYFGMQMQ